MMTISSEVTLNARPDFETRSQQPRFGSRHSNSQPRRDLSHRESVNVAEYNNVPEQRRQ